MTSLPTRLANRPFTYRDVVDAGLTKYALKKWILEGVVTRLDRGLYIPSDYDETDPESQFHMASLQCGKPSCICLLSALDFYHVTDRIPNKVWIMVPQKKRVRAKNLKLIRARNPHWNIGISKINNYWITTLPRTLVECLLYKRRIGTDVAISALKTALQESKAKLQEIIQVAHQMKVKHRISHYIETLAS